LITVIDPDHLRYDLGVFFSLPLFFAGGEQVDAAYVASLHSTLRVFLLSLFFRPPPVMENIARQE